MKLIIVRHGETEENKKRIIQGHMEGKLSEEGVNQAKKVGERLKNEKIDVIYTSDLGRAINTAKEIAKYHPHTKLIKRKEIREWGYGKLEGKQMDEINYDYNKTLPHYFEENKVEEESKIIERVTKFLNELVKKHEGENVVVVTHNGTINVFYKILDKNYKEKSKFENTSIHIYENGKFTKVNCIKHLK